MLATLLKKQIMTLKLQKLKIKINNHNHDKYIDTLEFNKLAGDVFNRRLAQLLKIKQIIYLFKMN